MPATRKWISSAPTVAEVHTITVGGTAAAAQVYSATMNNKVVSYTAIGGDTNTTIAAALAALLAASTITEFTEVAWTVGTTVITGTKNAAGQPFTNTSSATGTGTLVTATTVANSGPSAANIATNWSGATLPTTGDTIVFENNSVDCCFGLDVFNGVVLAAIVQKMSYTGKRGLPEVNAAGYQEYRPTYFQSAAATITIGDGTGSGSGLTKDDTGSAQTAVVVRGTGNSSVNGSAAYCFKGTHASNTFAIVKGSADIAYFAGETANVSGGIQLGFTTNVASDVNVRCGSGVTFATVTQNGGTLETSSNITTIVRKDGTHTILAGTVGTATLEGGTTINKGTGTMTTVTHLGGTLDFSQDQRAITVTTYKGYAGVTLKADFRRVTCTNGFNFYCSAADVTVDLGIGINLVVTAAA